MKCETWDGWTVELLDDGSIAVRRNGAPRHYEGIDSALDGLRGEIETSDAERKAANKPFTGWPGPTGSEEVTG